MPLRSIHGGIIRDVLGRRTLSIGARSEKCPVRCSEPVPNRGSFSTVCVTEDEDMTKKKKKKHARVKRFDCIPCAKVVVRSISLKLKIDERTKNGKL